MDTMQNIRSRQQALASNAAKYTPLPQHTPEILYVGCIDARLDPIDDIGIEKGKALIFRNIGAVVLQDEQGQNRIDATAALLNGEIPANTSIGATLEFFLKHIPQTPGKMRHIIISGHTDCGGMKACRHGTAPNDHYLPLYLEGLQQVRARIMQQAETYSWNEDEILHALEKEAVRQSMANLLTYAPVTEAIAQGTLEVHGWIIDTATQAIAEMNPATLHFELMANL